MAASNASPFEINDFSRGFTDQLFDQRSNFHGLLDNFIIRPSKKPKSRDGSRLESVTNAQVPSATRLNAMINYANNDKLFYQSQIAIYYRNPDAFQELLGPTGNHVFSNALTTSVPSFTQWNRHVYTANDDFANPMKLFKDNSGNYQVRSSGLPALASDPIITAGAVGTNSYVYSFYYSVDYQVFDLSYTTVGPVTQVQLENSDAPDSTANTISNIPILVNNSDQNYDTANITIQIFRTVAGGTFSQKVGEVTNGTTIFTDNVSDQTLSDTGIPLYINDGSVDHDPPPLHKFNHVVNNTAYYAFLKVGSDISPYKIRQSVPGVPDSGPIDFELEVDDEITGISSVQSLPIVACKKYIFRIDQSFDQFGRGNMVPVRISDHAGCISHNSLVQAEGGLTWLGNDGVYFTDGYIVRKVSTHLNDFYQSMLLNTTQKTRITGRYFEIERLVIWTIQNDSSNFENDSFLVLDLKWGLSDEMTFTTWSGASFRPSAIEIFNNKLYRGDHNGFSLIHDKRYLSDQKIQVSIPPADWTIETIIWKVLSIHYNFGSTFYRKMPTRVIMTAADQGNTTIQINAINDDGKSTRACKPIRIRRDLVWRDDDFVWRVSDFVWRGEGIIEQWRRFPAKSLRLSTMQLEITNGFSDITNSDALGSATFNNTLKTATLSSEKWPQYAVDYFIALENDNYQALYLVTARTDAVITLNDPMSTLPNGSLKWVMRGYKKDETLELLSYNILWTNVSQTQDTYSSTAASTGENT